MHPGFLGGKRSFGLTYPTQSRYPESSDLLAFAFPVVEELMFSNSGGCNRVPEFFSLHGRLATRLTLKAVLHTTVSYV